MIVNKNYECKLNLTCEDMKKLNLVSNIDELVLDILRDKYENKCYIGGFILDIISIIRRSQLKVMKELDDGTCIVSVLFETKSLIYDRGYIIPDMEVIEPRNNILLAKKDNINARFSMDSDFVGLSNKCKIPVEVSIATYNPGHHNIVIMGKIHKPKIKSKTYIIQGHVNRHDDNTYDIVNHIDDSVQEMLSKINEYNNMIKELDSNIVNYFCSIMYPYKKVKKVKSMKLTEIINHIKNGEAIPPLRKGPGINILSSELEIMDNVDSMETIDNIDSIDNMDINNIVLIDYNVFIRKMLAKHINNLNFIYSLSSTYDTMDKIKTNNTVWRIYSKYIKKMGFESI